MAIYVGNILDSICNEKRLYAGIKLEQKCPECGEIVTYDFNDQYISYGDLTEINFYCSDGCEHEWEVPARIISAMITIEVE